MAIQASQIIEHMENVSSNLFLGSQLAVLRFNTISVLWTSHFKYMKMLRINVV